MIQTVSVSVKNGHPLLGLCCDWTPQKVSSLHDVDPVEIWHPHR